ncbi:MAG: hypothetical protein ABH859_02570 [Pseudomonadota bacterium]
MNILLSTLKEELATVKRLEKKYSQELTEFPQGSFIVRKIRDRKYGYFTYREVGKVKQRYIGAVTDEDIAYYKSLVAKRKKLKEKLKSIRAQKKVLERALRGKTE